MLRTLIPFLLPLALAPMLGAQNVGTNFRNDLEVIMPPSLPLPAGSGSTSCFNAGVHSPFNAGVLQYRLSGAPSAVAAVVFLSFCNPCGGASTINLGSTVPPVCGGGNAGACPGGPANANLCWALNITPGCWFNAGMISAGAGWFHIRFNIPPVTPFTTTVWAQALLVDPCSTGGWHMSQALGIN